MPIESRGKKDPTLAARMKAGTLPEDEFAGTEFVVGRRPLKVGDETRQPGDPIPEASSWPRLESWLRSGAVVQRPVRARTVSEEAPEAQPAVTRPAQPQRRVSHSRPEPVREEQATKPVLRPYRGGSSQ